MAALLFVGQPKGAAASYLGVEGEVVTEDWTNGKGWTVRFGGEGGTCVKMSYKVMALVSKSYR